MAEGAFGRALGVPQGVWMLTPTPQPHTTPRTRSAREVPPWPLRRYLDRAVVTIFNPDLCCCATFKTNPTTTPHSTFGTYWISFSGNHFLYSFGNPIESANTTGFCFPGTYRNSFSGCLLDFLFRTLPEFLFRHQWRKKPLQRSGLGRWTKSSAGRNHPFLFQFHIYA